jgi:hypothetical protein
MIARQAHAAGYRRREAVKYLGNSNASSIFIKKSNHERMLDKKSLLGERRKLLSRKRVMASPCRHQTVKPTGLCSSLNPRTCSLDLTPNSRLCLVNPFVPRRIQWRDIFGVLVTERFSTLRGAGRHTRRVARSFISGEDRLG